MCCLLAQPHPHLVLFGTFTTEQGKDGHYDKHEDKAELHIRPPSQSAQKQTVGITDFHIIRRGQIHTYHPAGFGHRTGLLPHLPHLLLGTSVTHRDIPVVLYLSFPVKDNHRNGAVAIENGEHQSEVGIFICTVERAHGLGPYLHLALFLTLEVTHQKMGDDQRTNAHHHSHCHQQDLHLPHSVYPLHCLIITYREPVLLQRNSNLASEKSYRADTAPLLQPTPTCLIVLNIEKSYP